MIKKLVGCFLALAIFWLSLPLVVAFVAILLGIIRGCLINE